MVYLQSKYPQLIIEEFNIFEEARWLNGWQHALVWRRTSYSALFIGDYRGMTIHNLRPDLINPVLQALTAEGSPPFGRITTLKRATTP
jgi:hypothetical protein